MAKCPTSHVVQLVDPVSLKFTQKVCSSDSSYDHVLLFHNKSENRVEEKDAFLGGAFIRAMKVTVIADFFFTS